MDRISGQGVAASTGGPTTPGTAPTELPEQEASSPPPGLPLPDSTNWSLPLPGPPSTGGLPAPSEGPLGSGRQTVGPWASGLWVPGQWAPVPPMSAPSAPQEMLLVCQPWPRHPAPLYQQGVQPQSQPATPYQQAEQPPRRPAGRGAAAGLPSDGATPAASQTIPDHGRPLAREWGGQGWSTSNPGCRQETATNVPSTTTPEAP